MTLSQRLGAAASQFHLFVGQIFEVQGECGKSSSFRSSLSELTMRLLYKTPPDLSVSGRLANHGQVDVFLPRVFPDIVHPDLPLSPAFLSLLDRVHVKPRLLVFLPPSVPHVQTTKVSLS